MVDDTEKLPKAQNGLIDVRDLQKGLADAQATMKSLNLNLPESFTVNLMRSMKGSPMFQLAENLKRDDHLIRPLVGPLSEIRRAGLFDQRSSFHKSLAEAAHQLSKYESHFSLPRESEVFNLMKGLESSSAVSFFKQISEQTSGIQTMMKSMKSPWLDAAESLRSIRGFSEIQAIGLGLKTMNTFGDEFTSALRIGLGDWRDPIDWPENIFTDLNARTDFYDDLGFDSALSDFPAAAFDETVEIAGLSEEPPSLVDLYGSPLSEPTGEDERSGLARTNMAHRWLYGFETHMRRFIDEQMTKHFGTDWPKQRLPNAVYDRWSDRKQAALRSGRPEYSLIAYADFTDYEIIICKRDNWREVFVPFFMRPESVRETMQRLYPIRLDTMHARPIIQDDEVLLYVEVKRFMRLIRG